jgi:hypothetical protein
VSTVYELTRDVIAESVDAHEKSVGISITFHGGTPLTIVREAHRWGIVKGLDYCTVEIDGRHFNIAALVLENSIMLKRF